MGAMKQRHEHMPCAFYGPFDKTLGERAPRSGALQEGPLSGHSRHRAKRAWSAPVAN